MLRAVYPDPRHDERILHELSLHDLVHVTGEGGELA